MTSITVLNDNTNYSSIDGVLFNKDKTTIISYRKFKNNEYIIPVSVTSISEYCFDGCSKLTSINIPNGVTNIGDYAFLGCESLTSITIPDGVTSIGEHCFQNCSNLTSVNIPDGVTSIGEYTFYGCLSLTSITISDGVKSIGKYAFGNNPSLTSITVSEGNAIYSDIEGVLFNKNKTTIVLCPQGKSNEYIIPDGVTSIGNDAFYYCSSLTSITIPDGVTSIGNDAFYYCSSLTSITILRNTAPQVYYSTFGSSTSNYTGRTTYDQGTNILYVPAGATGYDTGYWLDPLCNPEKCGFTISYTL